MNELFNMIGEGASEVKPSGALARYRANRAGASAVDKEDDEATLVKNINSSAANASSSAVDLREQIKSKKKAASSSAPKPSSKRSKRSKVVSSDCDDDSSSDFSEDTDEILRAAQEKYNNKLKPLKPKKLERQFTERQGAEFFVSKDKSFSPKDVGVGAKKLKVDSVDEDLLRGYYNRKAKDFAAVKGPGQNIKQEMKLFHKTQKILQGSMEAHDYNSYMQDELRSENVSSSGACSHKDVSGSAKNPIRVPSTDDDASSVQSGDVEVVGSSAQEDDEKDLLDGLSNKEIADLMKSASGKKLVLQHIEKIKKEPKAKSKTGGNKGSRRPAFTVSEDFDRALQQFHNELKDKPASAWPTTRHHPRWEGEDQSLRAILKTVSIPLKDLRWNAKTRKTYEHEYGRYAQFCNKLGLDARPECVSVWSLGHYAEVLAKCSSIAQSRATYLSHFKCFAAACKPFGPRLQQTYSTSFGTLNALVAPRSQAAGVRLSHIIRLAMADDKFDDVVFTLKEAKSMKVQPMKKQIRMTDIKFSAALRFFLKLWFGMLRIDDGAVVTTTANEAGTKVKYHIPHSKTDPNAHGAEFTLCCCCSSTSYGPWHSKAKICPVCCCSDKEFKSIQSVLKKADNCRKLWGAFAKSAGPTCIPVADPSKLGGHCLRVGSICAALECGEKVEKVSQIARHKRVQSTMDYGATVTTLPDDVALDFWPIAKGCSIKQLCEE
eukprot:g9850.t1